MNTIHPVQVKILYELRHSISMRFNTLMRESGTEADAFKFHLKSLQKQKYIEKNPLGAYTLTAAGKEYANAVDKQKKIIQKQPKLSLMLVVEHPSEPLYLFHQRKRNPYFDYWGFLSGPMVWGDAPEKTASHELRKQTGLEAEFAVHAFYRQLDYVQSELMEDKLFTILRATSIQGTIDTSWNAGVTQWMSLDTLYQQPHHFPSTREVVDLAPGDYRVRTFRYSGEQY